MSGNYPVKKEPPESSETANNGNLYFKRYQRISLILIVFYQKKISFCCFYLMISILIFMQ